MSESDADPTPDPDADHGVEQDGVTPPVDAVATVAVSGVPVLLVEVDESDRLAVHLARDERGGGSLDDYDGLDSRGTAEVEVPDGTPSVEARVSVPSWVTVTVEGERRGRFTASAGEAVEVHLAEREAPLRGGAGGSAARESGGSTPQDGGAGDGGAS